MQAEEVAKTIDHTLLRADGTSADVDALCREAATGTTSPPSACSRTSCRSRRRLLKGTDVKTCTVISFPFGADTPRVKVLAADEAVRRGADEVDVVINVPAFLSGEFGLVRDELSGVVRRGARARRQPGRGTVIVKAIIETCYLDDKMKRLACKICEQAGVDFVKTSTGLGPHGATVADVELLRDCLDAHVGVKASGGIRTAGGPGAHGERRRRQGGHQRRRRDHAGAPRGGGGGGVMDHDTFLGLVRYNADGLVPCVVQAAGSLEVLMVAYANEAALRATLSSGEAHFWSRSRQELWHKGGTSGNVQRVLSAAAGLRPRHRPPVRRARRPGLPHRRGELLPRRGQRRRGDETRRRRRVSAGPAGRRRSISLAGVLLVAILVLALALRLKGVTWGLPYSFVNADESTVVPKAVAAARGHLNPQFFFYPSFYFYLAGAVYVLAAPVWWLLRQREPALADLPGRRPGAVLPARPGCSPWRWARRPCTSCTGSAGSPSAARSGLLAALFLAVAPLHVAYSHMAVTDVTAVALALLALVLLQRGAPAPGRRAGRAWPRRAPGRPLAGARRSRRRPGDVHQVQPRHARAAGDRGRRPGLPGGGGAARGRGRPRRARLAADARAARLRRRCSWRSSSRRRSSSSTRRTSCATSAARPRSWTAAGWGSSTSATGSGTT